MTTSTQIRAKIIETLQLDLVGPRNEHAFAHELLPYSPRRWYLTGYLVPASAPREQRESGDEEFEAPEPSPSSEGAEEEGSEPTVQTSYLPASIGITALVGPETKQIDVCVRWGDYHWEAADQTEEPTEQAVADEHSKEMLQAQPDQRTEGNPVQPPLPKQRPRRGYRRECREETVSLEVPPSEYRSEHLLANSRGVFLSIVINPVKGFVGSTLAKGTRSISVFLVNKRDTDTRQTYRSVIFQTEIELHTGTTFVGRPDLRGLSAGAELDGDETIAALHYRDVLEYAVGHGVATEAHCVEDRCQTVRTCWIPKAEVERVDHATGEGLELRMESLGSLTSGDNAFETLGPVARAYAAWIEAQLTLAKGLSGSDRDTALDMVRAARIAHDRMENGIKLLREGNVLNAFKIANRAMASAAKKRRPDQEPKWRPFQLAFLLMNLRSMAEPEHTERELVDLLFFPTGGGKTEAYFGLAAYTLALRRLQNEGIRGCGVSVLMRYTLRLLTLDQLGRAAALICALELERRSNPALGQWPFEIGLWVGSAATPNRMGHSGDTSPGRDNTAYTRTGHYKNNPARNASPIPLEECPWCAQRFTPDSFQFFPNERAPLDLRLTCINPHCEFSSAQDSHLPLVAVDDSLYRRLPCFIIATVDKFAALPWVGETGALFGKVQRHNSDGFYGPMEATTGTPIPGGCLPPPDLIIQDELHLISGPLGTIAGIYETAIEALCLRKGQNGTEVRPKIVASTATVRRANRQIRALFGRPETAVFPSPGINRTDSFFAQTIPVSEKQPGRVYLGLAAQGRSMKVIFLRSALALLSASQKLFEREGGMANDKNPVDPYMTALGYFNSLRDLGGTRRIVEDEVHSQLQLNWKRQRLEPEDKLFTSRYIKRELTELTSRVPTDQVAIAKQKLSATFIECNKANIVDVALATNMISVGLDIVRLGLMMVFGQPKTSSEYIQATSRVGRDKNRPGLVLTLMNMHRPRDRSHYERFGIYHKTFYRSVEASSVTPFAPRALDRGLAAAVVGLVRHSITQMEPGRGAQQVDKHLVQIRDLLSVFRERVLRHDTEKAPADLEMLANIVFERAEMILSQWNGIAKSKEDSGISLKYQLLEKPAEAAPLLRNFLDPKLVNLTARERAFCANRSMRDVEPSVNIHLENGTADTNSRAH
jgi:hypothetical protein